MTSVNPPRPTSSGITARQNEPAHLRRLLAYSRLYIVAQRYRRARAFGTLALAAIAPLAVIFAPSSGDLLAAISAGWLVLGRTILAWLEDHEVADAVRVHELYDTKLFRLPWNTALAGREPAPEDVAAAADHITDDTRYRDWYTINLGATPWPADVLLCQRQSMIWSRSDHRAYGRFILIVGATWLLVGVAVGIGRDLTLADYLIKIFLPSSPALLDSTELARAHRRHATKRVQAEHDIQDLWDAHRAAPETVNPADCRKIQDAAFLMRRDGPRVPAFFYKLRRDRSHASTAAGATSILSAVDD
jgi:SMODS-associating 4TM effector domain